VKIIEIPVFNADGSIHAIVKVSPEESQKLLEFAVNFMMATGHIAMSKAAEAEADDPSTLKDFNPENFNA
jgi:hypothetical protein